MIGCTKDQCPMQDDSKMAATSAITCSQCSWIMSLRDAPVPTQQTVEEREEEVCCAGFVKPWCILT